MKSLVLAGLLVVGAVASAEPLPPVVREALSLELQGHLGEALDRYRAALASYPTFVKDEELSQPLTVRVFSKAANLSIDLGYGEEAWDLGGRLLVAKSQQAAEAGTVVRLRLLRLQGRLEDAAKVANDYAKAWPQPAGPALLAELQQTRGNRQQAFEAQAKKNGGPVAWVVSGSAMLLPGPTDAWPLAVQETVRLQVGAFRDWANALTLIDMLREKGWVPFTDIKTGPAGEKLHTVYLVSRQPASDRARLEAQGLTSLP